MKRLTKLFALIAVFTLTLNFANAECCKLDQKTEVYAHPTMFSTVAQQATTANQTYVVGGKIKKTKNRLGLTNKDDVVISSWAKDVLNIIKTNHDAINFNPKMPILRSEFAVVLSESFDMKDTTATKTYSDIKDGYWAQNWIYRALNGGIMIGYPEGVFKPDQPITKAEVFATIATTIDVATDDTDAAPKFKGKDIKYIPAWAVKATQEVVNSKLLEEVPNAENVINDEFLTGEQVAYLVSSVRANFLNGTLSIDKNAPQGIKNYQPVVLNIKLNERISARASNIGDKFTAKTTNEVTVLDKKFPAGSIVTGEVVEIVRPSINNKNKGYIKVKFSTLKNGDVKVDFPNQLSKAQADTLKNPNIIARILGLPLTASARVVGVAGRTGASVVQVTANSIEQYGDQLANTFVNTASLKPKAGLKSFGNSFVTIGKGIFNLCELTVSGVFGVVYEIGDELIYVVYPNASNSSSLNPNEELTIIF